MEDKYVLYLHYKKTNNGIFYVGIGDKKRPYKTCNRNKFWHNIVNKHGLIVDIIATNLSWQRACELEKIYIKFYGRTNLQNNWGPLTNLTDGGDGNQGWFPSEETRKKMGAVQKGRIAWNKGKNHTEEAKRKMSAANKGHISWNKGKNHTEEAREKIRAAAKGRKFTEDHKQKISNAIKGKKLSDETKQKIGLANKGRKPSEEAKRKMSAAGKGRKHSEETRQKMSAAFKGRKHSEQARQKMSAAKKNYIPWNKGLQLVKYNNPHQLNIYANSAAAV